jgi:Tol biopolymer transport system component
MKSLIIFLLFFVFQTERKPGSPLDNLPGNIEILTHFGERADFSPDNQRIAFMSKSFGDAMVIDLKTRNIRCLTCNVPAATFLRVMHLPSGDYILIGPDHFENIRISRSRDNELWFLSKKPGSKPIKLDQKLSEGAAISKKNMRIAFSQVHAQEPDVADGASRILIADVELIGDSARLVNKRTVHESKDRNCVLEAQDFYDNDTKLSFVCYEPNDLASVWSIDLNTRKLTNFSLAPGKYNETEGIFPDGLYSCVESDRQCDWLGGARGSQNIDIWKLRLDGTGKDFVRLTNFNDYQGGKASNPVISTDGKFMAFQSARTTDPAGVGYGLLLYNFTKK